MATADCAAAAEEAIKASAGKPVARGLTMSSDGAVNALLTAPCVAV